MTTTVKAIYENGTLRLLGSLPLPEKTHVMVTIQSDVAEGADNERETWLKVSEVTLMQTWGNADDDVFNALRHE